MIGPGYGQPPHLNKGNSRFGALRPVSLRI